MTRDPSDASDGVGSGSESALIAEFWAPLAAGFPGAYNLKDDCAALAMPPGSELIVTTDALVAGVHFFPDEDAEAVGWKALAVNVSDLVAKAATPAAYVMSVALPALDRAWLSSFTAGLRAAQEAFGCHLIGGDTDRTPGPLSVSITAFGIVAKGDMLRRASGRPGDPLYVAGTIGDAALGLALRRDPGLTARCLLDDAARAHLSRSFSQPRPPLELIGALRACATAAIDISDGLMKDLEHLALASGTGARIDAADLPLSGAAQAMLGTGAATMAQLMTGGEDYTVLASVAPERAGEFERLAAGAGIRVTRIGTLEPAPAGIAAVDAVGDVMSFAQTGWDHFSRRSVS